MIEKYRQILGNVSSSKISLSWEIEPGNQSLKPVLTSKLIHSHFGQTDTNSLCLNHHNTLHILSLCGSLTATTNMCIT